MRSTILLLITVLACNVAIAAESSHRPNTITVTGKAEINVDPDQVVMTVAVDTFDRDLDTARRQNDERVARVLSLAREFSIPSRDVRTDRMTMETLRETTKREEWNDDLRHANPIRGYLISKRLTLRLTDLGQFDAFYVQLLKTGVSEITRVDFETSGHREHRDAARTLAMKAAREKAEAMAAALGQQIGRAVEIREEDRAFPAPMNSRAQAHSAASGIGLSSAGQIGIDASATVVFELR
jgi:uncharacterized protein YggE